MKVDFYRGGNNKREPNKKVKRLKFWQMITLKVGIYAVIAVIASFSILTYFDKVFLSETIDNPNVGTVVNTKIKGIPDKVSYLAFSYDKNYYVYLKDGVIYIKDAKTNALKTEIKDTLPIAAANLGEDRNIITYFTVQKGRVGNKTSVKTTSSSLKSASSKVSSTASSRPNDEDPDGNSQDNSSKSSSKASSSNSISVPNITYINPDTVFIKTYNIDNNEKTNHLDFEVKSGSKIKDVMISMKSSIILVNMETVTGSTVENNVYCVDITKWVQRLTTGKIVDKMIALNNSRSHYIYQTDKGTIYKNDTVIPAFKGKSMKLLGCDGSDNIYVQSKDEPQKIFVLKSEDHTNSKAKLDTITLSDTKIKAFHFNRYGIFAIYNDYVINVAGDITKKAELKKGQTFVEVVENRLYMKDSAGEISYLVENL